MMMMLQPLEVILFLRGNIFLIRLQNICKVVFPLYAFDSKIRSNDAMIGIHQIYFAISCIPQSTQNIIQIFRFTSFVPAIYKDKLTNLFTSKFL